MDIQTDENIVLDDYKEIIKEIADKYRHFIYYGSDVALLKALHEAYLVGYDRGMDIRK